MMRKSRVFWMIFMALAIFLFHDCGKKKSTETEPTKDKWTILGYFDGNNSQDTSATTSSYVIKDVQEMEQVGSTEDVKIIVMLGSIKTRGNCNYYLVEKHLDEPADSISSQVLDSLGEKDMSDPQTLRDFIKYGVEHYPAERYMLIINGDGAGWKGICSDQQNGDGEMMSLPEFCDALSGYKFEIVLFNAPSMSMLEVAYQLKNKANYLVASQFKLSMKNILSSSEWLQSLVDNPDISSGSLARNIVDEIYNTAESEDKWVHIAAIDLSKIDALASKVANLGNSLRTKAGAFWNEVFDAFNSFHSQVFDDSAFTDLKKFAEEIQKSPNLDSTIINDAKEVANAIGDPLIKSLSNPDYVRGGLSIHFPWKSSLFDSTDYVQLDFLNYSNWDKFLSHFLASISGYLGGLRIISIPDGADIFLNGEDTGLETDTTIHALLPGTYLIKVVKQGYPEKERPKTVESGKILSIVFDLRGGPGPFSPPQQADQ